MARKKSFKLGILPFEIAQLFILIGVLFIFLYFTPKISNLLITGVILIIIGWLIKLVDFNRKF